MILPAQISTLFPYTTLFRSPGTDGARHRSAMAPGRPRRRTLPEDRLGAAHHELGRGLDRQGSRGQAGTETRRRSEEHTSELQSHSDLVCRLLLEKKKKETTR